MTENTGTGQEPTGLGHNMPYLSKYPPKKKKPDRMVYTVPPKKVNLPLIIIPDDEKISISHGKGSSYRRMAKPASEVPKQTSSKTSMSGFIVRDEEFYPDPEPEPREDAKKNKPIIYDPNPPPKDTRYFTPFLKEPVLDNYNISYYFPRKTAKVTETIWQRLRREQREGPTQTLQEKIDLIFHPDTSWQEREDEETKKTYAPLLCCFDKRLQAKKFERTREAVRDYVEPPKIPFFTRCKTTFYEVKKKLTPKKRKQYPALEVLERFERKYPHGKNGERLPEEFIDKDGIYRRPKYTPPPSTTETEVPGEEDSESETDSDPDLLLTKARALSPSVRKKIPVNSRPSENSSTFTAISEKPKPSKKPQAASGNSTRKRVSDRKAKTKNQAETTQPNSSSKPKK